MNKLHVKILTPAEGYIIIKVAPFDTVYFILKGITDHYGYVIDAGHHSLFLDGKELNTNDTVEKLKLHGQSHLVFADRNSAFHRKYASNWRKC
jgi:hypothetical protein